MTRDLQFERLEDRHLLDGHLAGALADATHAIATFDLPGRLVQIPSAAHYRDELLFTIRSLDTDGVQTLSDTKLWKTDGTPEGSVEIETVAQGFQGRTSDLGDLGHAMLALEDDVYLVAQQWVDDLPMYPPVTESSLWRSDGTQLGTQRIADLSEFGSIQTLVGLYPTEGEAIVQKIDVLDGGSTRGRFWHSDGTPFGTQEVLPTFRKGPSSPPFTLLTAFGDDYVFGGSYPSGLFKYTVDTHEISSLAPFVGPNSFDQPPGAHHPVLVGEKILFGGNDGIHGHELWQTDGTSAGTSLLRDLSPSTPFGSVPDQLVNLNGEVLFTAETPDYGRELWKSDGTALGTELLADITRGPVSTKFASGNWKWTPVVANDQYFFMVRDDPPQLWRTDGTTEGTIQLAKINDEYLRLDKSVAINGKLFFPVHDGTSKTQIWMTDGTPGGTEVAVVMELGRAQQREGRFFSSELMALNDQLLFASGIRGADGFQLWSVDVPPPVYVGDIDRNGAVDFVDFLILAANFGQQVEGGIAEGDLDEDGVVSFADFLSLSVNYGKGS